MSDSYPSNLNEPSFEAPLPEPAAALIAGPHAELLTRVWQQTLPLMRERVDVLVQTADLASTEGLSPAARTNAADLAHKLAGSLGMFGFPRGTEIAREIENLVEGSAAPDALQLTELVRQLKAALPL